MDNLHRAANFIPPTPRPSGEAYAEDGYLVVPEILTTQVLEHVRAEAVAICRGQRGAVDGTTPAEPHERDLDVLRRHLCVHFPHKLSPLIGEIARSPRVVDILRAVIGPNVKMMQTMLFIKAEGRPGQAWHQDETHIPTRDRSLTGIWIALDDATTENGCLWVIPGSHAPGILYPDREQDDPRFDCTHEAYGFETRGRDAVPVEVPAGAAVVFNGYLLHRSLPNTGVHGLRRALVSHYMSAESLLPWFAPTDSTPMGAVDHRDIELVAGTDPYAFRGITDIMRPHVRPDRDGGCVR